MTDDDLPDLSDISTEELLQWQMSEFDAMDDLEMTSAEIKKGQRLMAAIDGEIALRRVLGIGPGRR
jgi:hypothetical protein